MSMNPGAENHDKGNPAPALDVSELWDADAYRREQRKCPWSFFCYPKVLADEQRLPRDEEALRYIVAIHKAGVRVGIHESRHAPNEIIVACPQEELGLLNIAIQELERRGEFPKDFGLHRYEYLQSLVNPVEKLVSDNPYEPPLTPAGVIHRVTASRLRLPLAVICCFICVHFFSMFLTWLIHSEPLALTFAVLSLLGLLAFGLLARGLFKRSTGLIAVGFVLFAIGAASHVAIAWLVP